MGLSVLFFNLAVQCFDVVAWPLFALGYPIWASIQAIETNSMSDIRRLITYWVSLSLILIFEELLKLPEWIPSWHFLKLILIGCLVSPYFDGSVYVYKHIIHPCLSTDPQVVINMFIKLKELFLEKYNLLVVRERDVIKEHESEALEKLIAFKPCFEAHEVAKNNISAVEIREKKETASAKKIGRIQPDLAPAVDILRTALEIKDLTASIASCRDVISDTRPCRSISKEWTCPMCQVTTTSEEVFISHLQGQRHEAASKKLKAKNRILQSQNSSSSVEIVAPKEMATAVEAGRDVPNKQFKSNQEWNCPICQVTTTDETAFIYHLQGRRHDAASSKLKANNQLLQSKNPCAAMEMGISKEAAAATAEGGEIPDHFLSKNIQEWTCPICQVTSTSETVFISHLQGRRHEVACEKLKAKNQMLQNENSAGLVKMDAPQEMATAMESGGDLSCKTPKNIQAASKMLKVKNQILRGENSRDSVKTVEPKEMPEAAVASGYLPNRASKNNIKECICPSQVIATSETIFISHLQGSQHEAASDKLKAENWTLQSKNSLDLMETGAHEEMATMSKAGSSLCDEPASKDIPKEWSSTVCQVISTNDTDSTTHVPGKQNEECKRLKADNQTSRSKVFPPLESYVPLENIEITTISTVANQDIPDKPHSKSVLKECTCGTCQITTSSDAELISQLQGERLNACEKLKKSAQEECACGTCQITTSSDEELISQLQGQGHNACEKLKNKKTRKRRRKKVKEVIGANLEKKSGVKA